MDTKETIFVIEDGEIFERTIDSFDLSPDEDHAHMTPYEYFREFAGCFMLDWYDTREEAEYWNIEERRRNEGGRF